jgi:hypothetical protein
MAECEWRERDFEPKGSGSPQRFCSEPCRIAYHRGALRASELLPAYIEGCRRKRDDGRAEASLMALWGLTHLPSVGVLAVPIACVIR